MGSVTLSGLTKVFRAGHDEIIAVDDADLSISDGEFVVLVGPSGSGKSTLLRCIAGLEEVTTGEIELDKTDITGIKPKNRDVAMVFQNYALYPHLTARGNMNFGLKMRGGMPGEEIESRVNDAAEVMEISEYLDAMPTELSGGQKQRVALGRAIVRDPAVFLMDEPLSNLDAKLRDTMRTEIQRLQDDLAVTTIYVTHDQREAMTMGDRIVIMREGEIQQIATPMEAYYEPNNRFVAGFIGSPPMNFFDGTLHRDGDPTFEHAGGAFSYHIDDAFSDAVPDGTNDLTLGIRPEDIEIVTDGTATVAVTIDVIEPLGKERLLYFDIDETEFTASVSGRQHVSENETVSLSFPESRVHFFDAETGMAVKNCETPDNPDAVIPTGER